MMKIAKRRARFDTCCQTCLSEKRHVVAEKTQQARTRTQSAVFVVFLTPEKIEEAKKENDELSRNQADSGISLSFSCVAPWQNMIHSKFSEECMLHCICNLVVYCTVRRIHAALYRDVT
mmetsp:Transcript_14273/g.29600  ORF Transcript_14273/g.29600 Transcript_14273/m.29600 type:complete len:119 (+) Transcript_14273:347-703(+)